MNEVEEFTELARTAHYLYCAFFAERFDEGVEVIQLSTDPIAVRWRLARSAMNEFSARDLVRGWKKMSATYFLREII